MLRQVSRAVDGVHDLEVVGVAGDRAQEPVPPEARLVGVARVDERLDGQGGVAQPAVAVVPVPLAAEVLGQRRRGRGDDAAGLLVGHQSQGEQGAPYDVRVRHVVVAPRRPRALVGDGLLDGRVSAGGSALVGRDPGHRERQLVAGATSNSSRWRFSCATGKPGAAEHELVGTGDCGDDLLAADVAAAHPRADRAVVHPHDPLVPHPDRAAHPGEPADHVGPVVAGGHQVEEGDLAVLGGERRLEGGGVVDVAPRDVVLARRLELPVPVAVVAEQPGEARGGVEAGQAEPVDGAVLADQCGGVPVADQGVVLDRQGHAWNSSRVRFGNRPSPPPRAGLVEALRAARRHARHGGVADRGPAGGPGHRGARRLGGVPAAAWSATPPSSRCGCWTCPRSSSSGTAWSRRSAPARWRAGVRAADRGDVRAQHDRRGRPRHPGGQAGGDGVRRRWPRRTARPRSPSSWSATGGRSRTAPATRRCAALLANLRREEPGLG